MKQFPRADSAPVILATCVGYLAGLTATLWVLRSYVDKKQIFVIGFTSTTVFVVTTLMRWYKKD